MSTQQQQAIIVPSPKAPFLLAPRDIPSPGKGEVLMKIMSVGLNPFNWAQREFNMMIDEFPAVLGNDVAGVVEALGEGVEGFKKGDKIFAQVHDGGFQQYTTLPASIVIRIPENASFDEVATFPITFTTACVGLFAPAPIGIGLNPTFSWDKPQQGESALVIGGGTSVGQFAIQLFKFLGFTRIVVYASKVHFDYFEKLGATECIDRAAVAIDSLATVISPVKVVYDATFTGALNAAYDCALDGGSVVTARPGLKWDRVGKKVTLVNVMGYYAGPDIIPVKDNVPAFIARQPEHTTFGKLIIKNLPEMLAKGVMTANRCEVLPNGLAGIPPALERMQKGGVSGVKLVAHPQDTAA
ncbi:chaperonin 10-like protein [Mycena epipterygia]|nr:chaperonin 10-like protein [Mycena epipterygia]